MAAGTTVAKVLETIEEVAVIQIQLATLSKALGKLTSRVDALEAQAKKPTRR
jgi:cell division protein FtsB